MLGNALIDLAEADLSKIAQPPVVQLAEIGPFYN
jgi:hypothetical protein